MDTKNTGYVKINFTEEDTQKVDKWSRVIPDNVLEFSGSKGGRVAHKLHVTLFFGFDDSTLDKVKLKEYLDTIQISSIKIGRLYSFTRPDYKIIYLEPLDDTGELGKINTELEKFAPPGLVYNFKPHITVAYVNKDFDLEKVEYSGPATLKVQSVTYQTLQS